VSDDVSRELFHRKKRDDICLKNGILYLRQGFSLFSEPYPLCQGAEYYPLSGPYPFVPGLYPFFQGISFRVLQDIAAFDVSGLVGLSKDLVFMDDLCVFVDDLVLQDDIFTDLGMCIDNTAFDDGTLADGNAAADDGILNGSADLAAVGNKGVLDYGFIIELGRAGIGSPGIDRPVRSEEGSGFIKIDEVHICLVIGLEAGDGSKEAVVLDPAHIELAAFCVDDVGECVDRGGLACRIHQVEEEILLHDEGFHEHVLVVLITEVGGDTLYLIAVQLEGIAGGIALLRVKYLVVEEGNVRAGFGVLLEQLVIVLCEDHAAGRDHDILLRLFADVFNVREERIDIGVVDRIDQFLVGDDDLDLTALGVDVVMTAGTDVCDQGPGLFGDINLNIINTAVAQVGNRKVDHTEPAEE